MFEKIKNGAKAVGTYINETTKPTRDRIRKVNEENDGFLSYMVVCFGAGVLLAASNNIGDHYGYRRGYKAGATDAFDEVEKKLSSIVENKIEETDTTEESEGE